MQVGACATRTERPFYKLRRRAVGTVRGGSCMASRMHIMPPALPLKRCGREVKCCVYFATVVSKDTGAPGRSVGRASDSWFRLRSRSQGGGIEPRVGLRTQPGPCCGFSPQPLPRSHGKSIKMPTLPSVRMNDGSRSAHPRDIAPRSTRSTSLRGWPGRVLGPRGALGMCPNCLL